jgi:hypothetical protein
MRWVKETVLVILLGTQTIGCTSSVIQAGAEDPRALVLLPVAIIGDLIAHGLSGDDKASKPVSPPPDPSLATWQDPDDWLASCDGPLLCKAPRQMSCYGGPGDCFCACEMEIASTSGASATATVQ